jgi:deoxyribonucleoside regulator
MARTRWTDKLLHEVAYMHHTLGYPILKIADLLKKDRTVVGRMLKAAKQREIVRTFVIPPIPAKELSALGNEVRRWFDLEDVVLVPGREDLMADPGPKEKEALVYEIALTAARYLQDHLRDGEVLAIPWGRMTSYIAKMLRPERPLPNLIVIPMVGVMGVEADPVGWSFEANALAVQIAAAFGGRAWQLPAPAVADRRSYKTIIRHPLVRRALSTLKEATTAVVPIAPVDPRESTVVRMGFLSQAQVEELQRRGAVGEIASHWWFDTQSNPIQEVETYPIGLGLEGLQRMVEQDRRVITVVGTSERRIRPLWVALQAGFVNTLITDHITAERLLELG